MNEVGFQVIAYVTFITTCLASTALAYAIVLRYSKQGGVLSGNEIINRHMISPAYPKTVVNTTLITGKEITLSFGIGPAGYDVRCEFDKEGEIDHIVLDPGQFRNVSTMEYVRCPADITGGIHDKSTWVRLGLSVHNSVIEPGWEGYLTIELRNGGNIPLRIDRGDPIAHLQFTTVIGEVKPYTGKYQKQVRGPQGAI